MQPSAAEKKLKAELESHDTVSEAIKEATAEIEIRRE